MILSVSEWQGMLAGTLAQAKARWSGAGDVGSHDFKHLY